MLYTPGIFSPRVKDTERLLRWQADTFDFETRHPCLSFQTFLPITSQNHHISIPNQPLHICLFHHTSSHRLALVSWLAHYATCFYLKSHTHYPVFGEKKHVVYTMYTCYYHLTHDMSTHHWNIHKIIIFKPSKSEIISSIFYHYTFCHLIQHLWHLICEPQPLTWESSQAL